MSSWMSDRSRDFGDIVFGHYVWHYFNIIDQTILYFLGWGNVGKHEWKKKKGTNKNEHK